MGTTTTVRISTNVEAGPQSIGDFTSSYRASLGQLVGYFRAKGVPREEAADLAHETIVRTLVHLKRHGRDRTDLGPLVRTIGRNLLIERVRKSSPVVVPITDEIEVADDGLEPADELVATERRDAVREAIRSLSPRHRHVVGMWMEGRTPTEIARALGIKRNAVDAILHRARRSLASKLDGRGLFGLIGIGSLRVRVMMRRVSEMVTSVDPSGQVTPAAAALATVGMAAVFTLGGGAGQAATPRVTRAQAVPVVHATATKAAPAKIATEARSTAATSPKRIIAEHTYEVDVIGTDTNPVTGQEDDGGVAIIWEPDAGRRTPASEVVDVIFEGCVSAGPCTEQGR
jgi:RNA polymerase sigma factor (sigma-70 family)